jgi:hypothetical protein
MMVENKSKIKTQKVRTNQQILLDQQKANITNNLKNGKIIILISFYNWCSRQNVSTAQNNFDAEQKSAIN